MLKLGKIIQICVCVFTFALKLEKWSFHVADLPRKGKKCTEIRKRHVKGVQSFCFALLNMQNLWRCRCRRVVHLNSLMCNLGGGDNWPISRYPSTTETMCFRRCVTRTVGKRCTNKKHNVVSETQLYPFILVPHNYYRNFFATQLAFSFAG